ncbi:MAG: hypothetical protein QGH70_01660 [Nitrospinota bacterium]|nr:hypothetical protein [Nitrospinota bacterium]MDP6482536.1 hypothetical protein [Nitrospinota bacterium]MDP7387165.1 hypothetical protein [Nitrospinota bacterium]HJM43073.1 hypothetical protein [Nitrospinota bacterium]
MRERANRHLGARWAGPVLAACAAAFVLGLASCTKDPLKQALSGKFLASENNRVISNYCRSCHVHRDFAAANHMAVIKPRYRVRKYREAEECRDCHSVKFGFFGPAHRRTLHPPDGRRL